MSDDADRRSQLERMLAGDLYQADDPEIDAMAARARRLVELFNRSGADEAADRQEILRQLLASIGEGTDVRVPFHCDFGVNLRIGARCFANFGLVVLDVAAVTIGDDVQIGPNVQLLTPTHPLDADLRRAKWEAAEPITIGDNVWLGGGAIVLPGVTVGPDAVVGAGAVVTRDVAPNVVVAGNPARVIRTL